MKTVLLLRHAKSVRRDEAAVADPDRPLTKRGRKAAARIGEYLRAERLVPDRVLCSTAVRARETWDAVAAELAGDVPVVHRADLYEAEAGDLLQALRQNAAGDDVVLLAGHNPGIQELALALSGAGDPDAVATMRAKFPTAGLAVIRFETDDWSEVAPGRGELERFIRPRHLPS